MVLGSFISAGHISDETLEKDRKSLGATETDRPPQY